MISVTFDAVDDEARSLANSLAGVVAALLVTRGQCTDAYTTIRRTQTVDLATEMQWQLLPPLSLDSGRVSIAGLVQPAYSMGGDCFDYAINGNILDFAVFDAMGHGLESSQLAHLAVTSYRHSRRSGLDLEGIYQALDDVVAHTWLGDRFLTCLLGRMDLLDGQLTWINVGHPLPTMVRANGAMSVLACEPTVPVGLGAKVAELAHDVLRSGDRLCCITDGVLDAHHPGGEDFGEDRFRAVLRHQSQAGLDTMETVRQISHTVRDHHGFLSDDTTIFLVEFH